MLLITSVAVWVGKFTNAIAKRGGSETQSYSRHKHPGRLSKLRTECFRKGCAEKSVLSPGLYDVVLSSHLGARGTARTRLPQQLLTFSCKHLHPGYIRHPGQHATGKGVAHRFHLRQEARAGGWGLTENNNHCH